MQLTWSTVNLQGCTLTNQTQYMDNSIICLHWLSLYYSQQCACRWHKDQMPALYMCTEFRIKGKTLWWDWTGKAISWKHDVISCCSTMVPAVEEEQNGRIQKKEVFQTDIQEVQMMDCTGDRRHLYTIYSRYTVTQSTVIHGVWFSICMGMQSLIKYNHLNTMFIYAANLWQERFL